MWAFVTNRKREREACCAKWLGYDLLFWDSNFELKETMDRVLHRSLHSFSVSGNERHEWQWFCVWLFCISFFHSSCCLVSRVYSTTFLAWKANKKHSFLLSDEKVNQFMSQSLLLKVKQFSWSSTSLVSFSSFLLRFFWNQWVAPHRTKEANVIHCTRWSLLSSNQILHCFFTEFL